MYFNEKLVALHNEHLIALSLFDHRMISSYMPRDSQQLGYAYLVSYNNQAAAKVNLQAILSEQLTANDSLAKEFRGQAKSKYVSQLNQHQYLWYAKQCEQTAYLYPYKVLFSKKGIGILLFEERVQNFTAKRKGWLVDVVKQQIISKELADYWLAINDDGTHALRLQTIMDATMPAFDNLLGDMLDNLTTAEKAELEKAMGAMNQAIAHAKRPTNKLEIVCLVDQQVIASIPRMDGAQHYAYWRGCWVVVLQDSIELINVQGETVTKYPFKGHFSSLAIDSQQALCALGLIGGNVLLLNLETQQQQLIRPHKGADKHAWVKVQLKQDGKLLASFSENKLIITDLTPTPAISYCLMELKPSLKWLATEGLYKAESQMIADFSLLGDKLAVLAKGQITLHDIPQITESVGYSSAITATNNKPLNNTDDLQQVFTELGLTRVARQLRQYLIPEIRFNGSAEKGKPTIGMSRIGGRPDLASLEMWPKYKKSPMVFVAQFNLAELAAITAHSFLPKTGLLSLFIKEDEDMGEGAIGIPYDNVKGDAWKIIYQPDMTSLITLNPPSYLPPLAITAIDFQLIERVLPAFDSAAIAALHLTTDEMEGYLQLLERVNGDEETYYHEGYQLLGYPHTFQGNDLELYCQLMSEGKDPYEYPQDPADMELLTEKASHWRLLLQIGSGNTALELGEFVLYLFIHEEDAKQGLFDNVWLACQC